MSAEETATLRLDEAKRLLASFAEHDAVSSPLYAHLASHAAADDDIAGLLTLPRRCDATPTLLLAAAHRLVAAEPLHGLADYYPTLGGFNGPDRDIWPLFRTFLLERADAVRELMVTRFTQTNEVQRAAVLYPGVALAAKRARGAVGLLEVGCSAGLLLGMDRFGYRYQCAGGEQFTAGPAKTAVGLHCAVDGPMPKPPKTIKVAARVGLDRAPVDAADEDELAWLEACVWADQPERARLLRTAAAAQPKNPPELIAGDAVDELSTAAERIAADVPLVLVTSHALTYLRPDRREAFVAAVTELAAQRPLRWVLNEQYEEGLDAVAPGRTGLDYAETGMNTLAVAGFDDGAAAVEVLAQGHPHGRRLTWLS